MILATLALAATIHLKDDSYKAATITVPVGATVTFVNDDDDAHTVTSTTGLFDSKGLDTHGVWKHTFKKPGIYDYFCELHPFMKGKIVVKAARP